MLDLEGGFTVTSMVDLVFRRKTVSKDLENLYCQCRKCGPDDQFLLMETFTP